MPFLGKNVFCKALLYQKNIFLKITSPNNRGCSVKTTVVCAVEETAALSVAALSVCCECAGWWWLRAGDTIRRIAQYFRYQIKRRLFKDKKPRTNVKNYCKNEGLGTPATVCDYGGAQ